jgi:uncharacterized membrane protein YdjX (TVP38/TMEM64 family)
MRAWDTTRRMGWPAKAVLALGLLAVLLVAVVPAALLVGVILMLLGHVVGGLALFGASVLAAVAAVVIASVTGVRHLRSLISRQGVNRFNYPVVQLHRGDYDYDYR